MANKTYAPRLPFSPDKKGNIANISDLLENVRQNLKMIVLTMPGEKIMDPNFGVGIQSFLFESGNKSVIYNSKGNRVDVEDLESTIKSRIRSQVAKYIPELRIDKITIEIDGNSMVVYLYYTYKEVVASTLTLNIGG